MSSIKEVVTTVVIVMGVVYLTTTLGMEWNRSHIRLEALSVYDSVKEVIGE